MLLFKDYGDFAEEVGIIYDFYMLLEKGIEADCLLGGFDGGREKELLNFCKQLNFILYL